MGHLAVTIPAESLCDLLILLAVACHIFETVQQLIMAADAVFLYYTYAGIPYLYHLRLTPEGEDGSMTESVGSLEVVFVYHVVVRYMAVVAVCPFTV